VLSNGLCYPREVLRGVNGTVCCTCIGLAEFGSELLTGCLDPSDSEMKKTKEFNLTSISQITNVCLRRLRILKNVHVTRIKMFT